MATDANILMGYRAPKFTTPQELYAQLAQFDQNELANRMGNMKMQEYEGGVQERNALSSAYKQFGADPAANVKTLYQGGFGKQAQELQKAQVEEAKTKAATEKDQLANALSKLTLGAQLLSSAKDQASYDASRAEAQANGLDVSRMPPQFDPAIVASKLQESQTIAQQLEQKWKAMSYSTPDANARLSAQTSRDNNRASVGASYANAAATREIAKSTRDAAGMQRDQATEMKLADDYRAQSKGFKEVGDAYKTISATLDKSTTSAAATLAGATKFMKLLDPGSVVRESELGMALAATGVLDRATNYFNTLKYGKVLTPSQAADFKNITAQIYQAAQSQQKTIDGNYRKQAETYKLRPEMIIQDLGQNATPGGKNSDLLSEADRIIGGKK